MSHTCTATQRRSESLTRPKCKHISGRVLSSSVYFSTPRRSTSRHAKGAVYRQPRRRLATGDCKATYHENVICSPPTCNRCKLTCAKAPPIDGLHVANLGDSQPATRKTRTLAHDPAIRATGGAFALRSLSAWYARCSVLLMRPRPGAREKMQAGVDPGMDLGA